MASNNTSVFIPTSAATNITNGASNQTYPWQNGWNETMHTALVVFAVVIIIVNLPVVIMYFKITSLRHSSGNTFLVNLALADLLCACVMIPTAIICDGRFVDGKHYLNTWTVYLVSWITLSIASVYHIVAATVAKYFAIVHPMRNITACTNHRIHFIVVSIWIVSFLVGHIPFYVNDMEIARMREIMINHAYFLIGFAFVIPTLILVGIHVQIYLRVFQNMRSRALITTTNIGFDNNRRIVILFFILFLFFTVSWLPSYLLYAEVIHIESMSLFELIGSLRYLAPIINPIMFTFMKRDFRKAATSLVTGLSGKQRGYSSRRSVNTQATSSVDRTNFIEQQNNETVSKVEQREETTVNEQEEMQII